MGDLLAVLAVEGHVRRPLAQTHRALEALLASVANAVVIADLGAVAVLGHVATAIVLTDT